MLGQPVEAGQQVVVVEVGPAVQHDDRRAPADVADVQSSGAGDDEAGARVHVSESRRGGPGQTPIVSAAV
jgi:hypothetical protein